MKPRFAVLLRFLASLALFAVPMEARASIFQGETLDSIANFLAWVVLIVVPLIVLAVFWLVHILPEKIAEKRNHPQAKAIQVLCLLSLFFGGMLWPLAWLWAYSKPVLYKLAYGTDQGEHGEHEEHAEAGEDLEITKTVPADEDVDLLRARIAELEARLDRTSPDLERA